MTNANYITPENRAAAAAEEAFKLRNQSKLSDSIKVVVYSDYTTESPPSIASGTIIVRAMSLGGHHDHLKDPNTCQSSEEARKEILKMYQATIEADNPYVSQLINGSTWKAFKVGPNLITLISPEKPSIAAIQGVPAGTINSFNSGNKAKLSSVKRTEGSNVEMIYNTKSATLNRDMQKKHYSNFFKELTKRLSESAFTSSTYKVNSLTRTPTQQANAMINGRFGNGKPLSFLRSWFDSTYGKSYQNLEMRKVIFDKEWTDPAELKTALATRIQELINDGYFKKGHGTGFAVDLRTNNLSFSDVKILLSVLATMKSENLVTYYSWEGVTTLKGGGGEEKRRVQGVFDSNEHIHLSINKAFFEGE